MLRELRSISVEMGSLLVSRRFAVLAMALMLISLGVGLVAPNDQAWLQAVQMSDGAGVSGMLGKVAQFMSYWGDFLGFNLVLLVGLLVVAKLRKSRFLRQLVVISLLGSTFAGLSANIGRASFGRARPSADVTPGFYGPTFSARLHSFPSGHTATAFGASIPLAVAYPPLGIPLTLTAGTIGWSRMFNNRHHPSDVMASACLAILFGVPLGLAVRRRRARWLADVRSRTKDHHLDPAGARDVETPNGFSGVVGKLS